MTRNVEDRRTCPENRQFSSYQEVLIKDSLELDISIASITHFSMSPPELMFANQPKLYLRWFTPSEFIGDDKIKDYLHHNIKHSHWIDGTNHRITLKLPCLDEIIDYAKKYMDKNRGVLIIFKSIK